MKEIELQKLILDYLSYQRGLFWRNNTTGVYDQNKKLYRLNKGQKRGVADILGVLDGRAIAIEVKATGIKRLSEYQEVFKAEFEGEGGIYYLANDFNEFVNWFKNL